VFGDGEWVASGLDDLRALVEDLVCPRGRLQRRACLPG
jgi:hypothetical protein